MRKFKAIILKILTLILFLYLSINKVKPDSIEDLNISLGLGYSIIENTDDNKYVRYQVPLSLISYKGSGENENIVRSGISESIGRTRDDRQRKLDKRFFLGMERIYIMDKTIASFGIEPILNILFKNPNLSDAGYLVICGGKSEDYLRKEVEGYVSPAEYIEGMIRNLPNSNFFGKNYTMADAYLILATEGKNLVAPYIELSEQGIKLTGMAVFSKDKMLCKIPYEESKLLTLMRYNNVKGNISLMDSQEKYIDYYINSSKRNIKCYKDNQGKLNFHITLTVKGTIESNTTNKDIDYKLSKNIEARVTEKLEEQCNKIIKDMQNKYIIDFLQLGSIAVAKYGRENNIDWDKEISNSKIEVKVKAKVEKVGRGKY